MGHRLAIPRFARRTTPAPILHAEPSRRVQSLLRQPAVEPAFHDNHRQIPQLPPASLFLPERQRACSNIPSATCDSVDNVSPRREIMRKHSAVTITGAVLTTLLLAFAAFAHDHTALNGTWTLVPTKSDFAGQPVVQTGSVTINERQGVITVSRSFMYEGAAETFFYRDITDAENNATIHTGKDLKSKTSWDHDVLKVTTTQYGTITLERYTLAADGTMMVSVARPNHKPITLVFQHKND